MKRLSDCLAAHARRTPDRVAISDEQGRSLTWKELHERVTRRSWRLRQDLGNLRWPVALAMDQGIAWCVADLALLEAGVPCLPLPAFFTPEQRAHVLRESGAQAILYESNARDFDIDALMDRSSVPLPSETSKVSYTSGSTGTPKGICLSAGHLLAVAQAVVDSVGSAYVGKHLPILPPGILLENVAGLYATMLAGGTYLAWSQQAVGLAEPFRPDFPAMAAAIDRAGATSVILVPEYLAGLVHLLELTGKRLPSLTLVAVGGARVSPLLLERAAHVGLPVRQGYGLTECGSVVALEGTKQLDRGSVGRSIGVNHITLAADGEILIEGPACLGTIGGPPVQGPLATGDIGRFDSHGRLWIEGRKSSLIITSYGRNVAPEWIESVIAQQPGIAQVMVHGDGQSTLGALVVTRNPGVDVRAALDSANATLPAYAHVDHWRVVEPFTQDNGLLTGNGRLRRRQISRLYIEGEQRMRFFQRLVEATAAQRQALAAVPQLQAGMAGAISRDTYIDYLTQAYHHVRHTVPLLKLARARLAHKPRLAAALDAYVEEETGHEQWILNDIAAAGGNRDRAAASAPGAATAAMVRRAYECVEHGNPAGLFGMVYVLEGTSVAMATRGANAIAAGLGLPPEAFTYLTSHGELDQDHIRFFADLMDDIEDSADQQAIILVAHDMFVLFAGVFASVDMGEQHAAA
ncbi:MAG: AMP-binding protein [Pseudomonadota bacterium]